MFRAFVIGWCRLFLLTLILCTLSLSSPAHSKQLQEKWTLTFSYNSNFLFLKSPRGSTEKMITGSAVLFTDQSGNVSGNGTMSITTHSHSPGIYESSGSGHSAFNIKGVWIANEIIFTFQGDTTISITSKSLIPPYSITTLTQKVDSANIASNQIIERKNGAKAKSEARYYGSKKGYLSKLFDLSGEKVFPTKTVTSSADLSTKKDTCTLELLSEFNYPTVTTKTEGEVKFFLPDGDGPLLSIGTATLILYTGKGTKAENIFLHTEGDLQIEGKLHKNSITFNAICKARKSQSNSYNQIMDPGQVQFSDEKISMKLKNGAELVKNWPDGKVTWRLKCQMTGVLVVSPTEGLFADLDGDKIETQSKTYTLKNTGKESIDFAITKKEPWVKLSQIRGSLQPGASTNVTVSIDGSVKKIKFCKKKDTLKFSNLTNGKGDTSRLIQLTKVERWQVDVNGWERHRARYEGIRAGTVMTGRIKYQLQGVFKLKKNEHCKCEDASGHITRASVVRLEPRYTPDWFFDIKDVKCANCNVLNRLIGKPFRITCSDEKVSFGWGSFEIIGRVLYQLTKRGCAQLPNDCGKEFVHELLGDEFQNQIKFPSLPLQDGFQGIYPGSDQDYGKDKTGVIWIQFTYRLKKLN